MVGNRQGVLLITFILCCHIVGILLFCNGFLLKRVIVPEYSKCSPPSPSPRPHTYTSQRQPLSNQNDPVSNFETCTGPPRTFKRVLWLLIDALRYDFMVYDGNLDPVPVYRNKMTYVRDVLNEKPRNAKLFKFVADPPTTTMQRLKALTTGGLPTFIDIGSNFNSYKITEDNLIYQARENDKNVTFMGDDTWLGLYPDMFTKVFEYPSLNVKDLHTVDNGVIDHMLPEIAKSDADIIIAHFLGVDHVGHTYGPSHWTMGEKLTQLNDVLKSVLSAVDKDTIVFVFGDHGMTSTGDHGGETEMETGAALLVYSPRPLFDPSEPLGRSVNQIDLVPTVSLILGIPIPFSSLGMIIPEVFLPYEDSDETTQHLHDGFSDRVTLEFLNVLRINAQQVQEYLVTYAQYSGDFPSSVFHSLNQKLDEAIKKHREIEQQQLQDVNQIALSNTAALYVAYMKEVKAMCQSVWAKFDNLPIIEGLILLVLVVVTTPLMLLNINESSSALKKTLYTGFALGLALTAMQIALVTKIEFSTNGLISLSLTFCFYSLLASNIGFLWYHMRFTYLQQAAKCVRESIVSGQVTFLHVISVAITILNAVAMLSNSFVLYEGDMVAFFLQTMIICFAVRNLQSLFSSQSVMKHKHTNTYRTLLTAVKAVAPHIGLMYCVRVVKIFYACRDLQIQDGCEATTFILSLPTASEFIGWLAKWRYCASCVGVLSIPISLIALLWTEKKNAPGYLHRWLLGAVYVGMPLSFLCVAGFWALQNLSHSTLASLTPLQHVLLPRIVYLVSVTVLLLCVFRPLKANVKLSIEDNHSEADLTLTVKENQVGSQNDSINTLQLKTRLRKQKPLQRDGLTSTDTSEGHLERPPISSSTSSSSLRDVVSLVVLILLVAIWLPVAMVVNDGLALSAFIMAAQVSLAILALRWTETGTSWPVCVFWGLMSCQFFFGFGHHATITSLRFEAGFVGIYGEMTTFTLPFAGALVGLNTLASQILFGLGLPLLLVLECDRRDDRSVSDRVLGMGLRYISFHSIKMLVSILAASIHRRHLMVWWVFAPRFMYEGAFQVTTDVCILLAYALVARLERQLNSVCEQK